MINDEIPNGHIIVSLVIYHLESAHFASSNVPVLLVGRVDLLVVDYLRNGGRVILIVFVINSAVI